ncbi:MAG TPA: FtsW/RodA/SpoVE family cell cycle protein [Bryobacteraceae bacterium]|nr:FtsW/RodA/SpoVE family cell cycle protein [Bryobacteraceae bacterium]
MAVTKSWESKVVASGARGAKASGRIAWREFLWLAASSLLVAAGLLMVYSAKTQDLSDASAALAHGALLDLNSVSKPEQLLPFLKVFPDDARRRGIAEQVFNYLSAHHPLPNVGALARLRSGAKTPLLPLARLKPQLIVRTPPEFQKEFLLWIAIYLAAFHVVFLVWRWSNLRGDFSILPAIHLLTGMGLILAVSLRDPLRDTLEFSKFAWGVALGCAVLLAPSLRFLNYQRFSNWCYTPLFAALALFALLVRFGSGPGGNDAKVNLGPFQPVEAIKILLIFFLAGYFARNWERLRDLREKKLLPRWAGVPRLAHVLPVMFAVVLALGFFFMLKDLGPALVTGFLFLALFWIARGRAGLAVLGIALLIGGVTLGYRIGKPTTVVDRINMWLSPWDNDVHGGNQLAHSLWAFSTGGALGSGPGWGDPEMIPAGHTDLVLPAIGEEWGFSGVATVLLLLVFLVWRGMRIGLRAPNDYGMFLALGLSALIAFEMLLISGGVLGVIPLSGVVSPFLSFGNTAMLANFLIFGILISISQGDRTATVRERHEPFRKPVTRLAFVWGAAAATLLAFAAYYQIAHDQDFLSREAKVFEDDGVKRPQRNPRLNSLAHEIRRGNIFDRNGVLLATSDWNELERRRDQFSKLGISIDTSCSRLDNRHYPFGPLTAHLVGDLRTGDNFHATNASLIEHDSNPRLQGFSDYRELAPLIRYRHQPGNPAIAKLMARDRDVHASIDIRLQMRATKALQDRLAKAHKDKGAVVVMDPNSGDVLALVSAPETNTNGSSTPEELLDRARYGQYPPGSTFKLVTAMAALRMDPGFRNQSFSCRRLPDGRVGAIIPGWRKPIRDDVGDSAHGTLTMHQAITVSCNAYFAQIGVFSVGAQGLSDTAKLLEIPAGSVADIQAALPFASYGQGPVLVTPFKMARVAATIAANGAMPEGRWVTDASNARSASPKPILAPDMAGFLANAMRSVVQQGTARRAMAGERVSVAGKTGTAQLDEGMPHSWFAGFAPYDGDRSKSIAFAVVVEHGGYGGSVAAPIAREIVDAAADLGLIQ